MRHDRTDVCVAGAGPAGSLLACRLAQLGLSVRLVERARAPRARPAETLTPGVLPLLDGAGAREVAAAAALARAAAVLRCWDGGTELRQADPGGVLVDRARFDVLLLEHARALGVRVLRPASIRRRTRTGAGWCLDLALPAGDRLVLRAGFLAEATGRAGSGRSRRPCGPRTTALFGAWRGTDLPRNAVIEAGADEWYWGQPLPNGAYAVQVFLDSARLRGVSRRDTASFFADRVRASRLLAGCAAGEPCLRVGAADATPYADAQPVAADAIRVGDAALALDPLSSTGVQSALQSSLAGAVVINTLLRRPEDAVAATRFYAQRLERAAARHSRWSGALYGAVARTRPRPFWLDRATGAGEADASAEPDAPGPVPVLAVALSPLMQVVAEPCLEGDFVALRSAVQHPSLEAPVAFLSGRPLVPLLAEVRAGMTTLQIAATWATRMAPSEAAALLGWLLRHRLLVPSGAECPAAST